MSKKKKEVTLKHLVCAEGFRAKSNSSGVVIEGFANKATVDRGDEIIATDAWELDNFKKNPVILFNHGFDKLGGTPVGRATEVRATDDGLYLKVKMSNSQAPDIKMVRDLVEERILKAFSVGFSPKQVNTIEIAGKSVRNISKAELFEVSIVGVPMNQDSLFELSEKTLATLSFKDIKSGILKSKGASRAAEIEAMIPADGDRKAFLRKLAINATLPETELLEMLAGDLDVSDVVYNTATMLSKAMDLEAMLREALEKLEEGADANEVAAALAEGLSGAKTEESEEDGEGDTKEDADKEGESSGSGEKEGESPGVSAEGGDSAGEEDADKPKKDFQDCVSTLVPKLLKEGMEQDQAVAVAISKCQEQGKCALTEESKAKVYSEVFASSENGGETAVALETIEFKQVDESQQAVQPPTTPVKTEDNPDQYGNPHLEAAKQTNVLLGALINEIQKLGSKMDGLTQNNVLESEKDPAKDSETGSDNQVSQDAQKTLDAINQRLKNLGY